MYRYWYFHYKYELLVYMNEKKMYRYIPKADSFIGPGSPTPLKCKIYSFPNILRNLVPYKPRVVEDFIAIIQMFVKSGLIWLTTLGQKINSTSLRHKFFFIMALHGHWKSGSSKIWNNQRNRVSRKKFPFSNFDWSILLPSKN
jgi:hypothetical protein